MGFAHIGILKVFEENNIPIDLIAGCSMGALLGGIYASGCPLKRLQEFAAVFDQKKYFDFTISGKGYLKGAKIQELVKTMTKNMAISAAPIPFTCIATCVEDATLVRFTDGPMHEAIRASISIPGVFSPHTINGKTYIDGGVMDRTAIGAAREMGADVVIAVDVAYKGTPLPTPKNGVEVLLCTFSIMDWCVAEEKFAAADVLILPDLSEFDGNRYKNIDQIIERGRNAAEKMLPDIRRAALI